MHPGCGTRSTIREGDKIGIMVLDEEPRFGGGGVQPETWRRRDGEGGEDEGLHFLHDDLRGPIWPSSSHLFFV